MPAASPEPIYDVLPDGTRGDPIDFNDAEALIKLAQERMTPENFYELTVLLCAQGYQRDSARMLTMLAGASEGLRRDAIAEIARTGG